MSTAVVIVAAGRGVRAGGDMPKQYQQLGAGTVLAETLKAFSTHSGIDMIQPVIAAGDDDLFGASADGLAKLRTAVPGGDSRQDSVHAGLEALSEVKPAHVLIHDAARPFVDAATISRVLGALATNQAAIPALPVADTMKRAEDGIITGTVERTGLWAAQTPQGFHFDAIVAAHREAAKAGRTQFTDDAAIAEWAGIDVAIVEGGAHNRKITTAGDLAAARAAMAADVRVGQGFDVHAFEAGRPLMLGGIEVPHDQGLKGHSDADVALHALTDAILGAIGDGDIGSHFPPSDPKWRDADSDQFLAHAGELVAARGGVIAHTDVTIVCEAPKIGPHREAMRARIAEILGIEPGRVAVKATTSEGLGFTGRREGISAHATATVRLPLSAAGT